VASCPGIERAIPDGDPLPAFDVHSPLMNLTGVLKTTLPTIPAPIPYLAAEPAGVEFWRQRLEPIAGFKVGIAWQGNPRHPRDRARSFPLALYERLARVEGVRLISLQKGPGVEQLRAPRARGTIPGGRPR
jgi:hypothetical protein